MKNIIIKILSLVIVVSIAGCSSDYFDVNTPSNAADEDQLRMNDLLAPTIYHTFKAQYWAERSFGNYTQQFTGEGGITAEKSSISGAWSEIYLRVLPNLKAIQTKAAANNSPHFDGVSKILTAINIGLAADSWDDVPYSEASQGSDNISPDVDSQEDLYAAINTLLTEAIAQLQQADNSGFSIGSEDLVYGGDVDSWIKAAYTLKARYELHLGQSSAALASLANGFTSNADDFQISFDEKTMNPWYTREILAAATSNAHDKIGDQLVSYMNGTSYPFEEIHTDTIITNDIVPFDPINNDSVFVRTIDPRLPVYAENGGDLENWRGYVTGGSGLSSDGADANTNFKNGGFYTSLDAPIILISYAEALFIKAEVEFLIDGGTTTSVGSSAAAYTAYMDGIAANMSKMDVDGADYMADTAIDVGEAGLKLEHIMKEKYIANFLNPENFVDFRRYDFSPDVYRDLSLPEDHLDSEYPNEWMLRATYPDTEVTRNPNISQVSPITPVGWDE